MCIALLVLLNMLLAIVMSNYDSVVTDLKAMPDAPTLFAQTRRYRERTRRARKGGWAPIDKLLQQLSKVDCHTAPEVSAESIEGELSGVTHEQAGFLFKWLQKDANAASAKQDEDPVMKLAEICFAFVGSLAENLHSMGAVVMRSDRRLDTAIPAFAGEQHNSPVAIEPPRGLPSKVAPPVDQTQTPSTGTAASASLDNLVERVDAQQTVIKDMAKGFVDLTQRLSQLHQRLAAPDTPTTRPGVM